MRTHEIWSAVFRAIPGVENLGSIPSIKIDDRFCLDRNIRGRYEDGQIIILNNASELTIAHEIGHWVYESIFVLSGAGMHAKIQWYQGTIHEFHWKSLSNLFYAPAIAMLDFLENVKSTEDYKNLELWKPNDFESEIDKRKLLSLSETWANAFAQTIAKASPNSQMAEDLKSCVVDDKSDASLWENDGYWRSSTFNHFELDERVHMCLSFFAGAPE